MYLQSVSMMPKGIFYADLRLANYLYFEVPFSYFSCFSKSFNRLHRWNKLHAVLIEVCAFFVHGFAHQLDRLYGLGRL